jgi:hypothetical protein
LEPGIKASEHIDSGHNANSCSRMRRYRESLPHLIYPFDSSPLASEDLANLRPRCGIHRATVVVQQWGHKPQEILNLHD